MNVPHTLIYQDGEMYGWSDPIPEDIGGGRDKHIYQVETCGDQTRFVQSDEIVGNPYAANFATQPMPMYQTFNAELKAAVENRGLIFGGLHSIGRERAFHSFPIADV